MKELKNLKIKIRNAELLNTKKLNTKHVIRNQSP